MPDAKKVHLSVHERRATGGNGSARSRVDGWPIVPSLPSRGVSCGVVQYRLVDAVAFLGPHSAWWPGCRELSNAEEGTKT